ncbi:MAG: GNAT family N-acetyltransferase [Bacteroidota bacterium]
MNFKKAQKNDVAKIVELLANDKLGSLRENFRIPLPQIYYDAFERIDRDENQELMVIEKDDGDLIGTLQLTFIPYLTYQGGIRTQIEAVRVRADQRGQGVGEKVFKWAIARAKEKGAHLLQLTTDKKRPDTIRFYEKLGFKANHEGIKLHF